MSDKSSVYEVVKSVGVTIALVGFVAYSHPASTDSQATGNNPVEMSPISGSVDKPRRHSRLRAPADLSPDEANRIYTIVAGALTRGYAFADLASLEGYQNWTRYNSAPYLSSTHGNHYLNNYANEIARGYGDFERAGTLPEGSIVAKDSFTMTRTRGILLGPLYVMEKMAPGFNQLTGDWKFVQVQPDGELFGETNGRNAERVDYCIGCHLAKSEHDYLYFIPEAYRN